MAYFRLDNFDGLRMFARKAIERTSKLEKLNCN
jgi:hypothetical protein